MSAEKILGELQKRQYKPVYWLEGEEPFFIDQVMDFAGEKILNASEAEFNLTTFYGRDAAWPDVINACRRYPMFAERQVVIIKEAQDLKGIERLESYIEKPLTSTLLFVAYKNKKVDGRTKLARLLKEKAVFLSTKKMYDSALPEWTSELVKTKGFSITKKVLFLLIDHIGNDLNRLSNEVDKLVLNLAKRTQITEDDIEKFVGISKEFNVFELQQAVAQRDLYNAIRITNYFSANPKAAPLPFIFPSLYNFFSKVQIVYTVTSKDEKAIAGALGVSAWFVKDYIAAASKFSYPEIEKLLLLLYEYNLRNLGVNDAGTDDGELLKEMIVKIIAPL